MIKWWFTSIENREIARVIEYYGKNYRKTLYLMVKTMVSCRFSLNPIQWQRLNLDIKATVVLPHGQRTTIPLEGAVCANAERQKLSTLLGFGGLAEHRSRGQRWLAIAAFASSCMNKYGDLTWFEKKWIKCWISCLWVCGEQGFIHGCCLVMLTSLTNSCFLETNQISFCHKFCLSIRMTFN